MLSCCTFQQNHNWPILVGEGEEQEKKEGWSEKGRKEEKEGEEREAKEENEREQKGKGVDIHSGKEKGNSFSG